MELIRFPTVLVQFSAPLKVNVYEYDPQGLGLRIFWSRGHVFQLSDVQHILVPTKRLYVIKAEYEAALKELEATPLELAVDAEAVDPDRDYWAGMK
jgi:hypothetical protein